MVTMGDTRVKESAELVDLVEEDSLREERRRTGRYVASAISIFVSLFGLYQALARGTPEYAAFFLPALIMFLYVLWILYASSQSRRKLSLTMTDQAHNTPVPLLEEVKSGGGELPPPILKSAKQEFEIPEKIIRGDKVSESAVASSKSAQQLTPCLSMESPSIEHQYTFCRTYSIA